MTGTDFVFVTIIDKHLLAHISLQRTPLTRAGGRVEVVASLSQGRTSAAQCGLVYTQISPGHILITLYVVFQRNLSSLPRFFRLNKKKRNSLCVAQFFNKHVPLFNIQNPVRYVMLCGCTKFTSALY